MQRGIIGNSPRRTAGLALGLAAALTGCAANGGDEGMVVLKNVVPMAAMGGCTFNNMESETSLVRGVLDIQITGTYQFIAQVKSRITALAGQESQRTIFTRGANVDITFPDASVFSAAELAALNTKNALHFMTPFTAPIAPNGGVQDVLFDLIPADVSIALLAKQGFMSTIAQTSFTVVGDLAGGDISSQKFQYTVTITNGGLKHDVGACSTLSSTFTPRVGNPCNAGQDGVVDCCSNGTLAATCPAMGTGM